MTIKPSSLIEPLVDAGRAAKGVPNAVLHDAALLGTAESLVREAKLVGLVKEAASAEKQIAEAKRLRTIVNAVEKRMVQLRSGFVSVVDYLDRLKFRSGALDEIIGFISPQDRTRLAANAARLVVVPRAITQGLLNNMAGAFREVVAKYLAELVVELEDVAKGIRNEARGSKTLGILDSALSGDVQLPARMKGGERALKLGSDRLMGLARNEPMVVEGITIAGVLEVRAAVEVKGVTTAGEGIAQLQSLAARGKPGYVAIGGQLWLIKYDPARVRHFVVAPAGAALDAARKLAAQSKSAIKVIPISKELESGIQQGTRDYLEIALETLAGK